MYAVTTDAMEANGGPQRSNNRCLRPECLVEAAARDFEGFNNLKAWRMLCTRKTQAAMLEQQRLTARGLGGSCREEAVQQLEVEAAARELEGFRGFKGFKRLKPGKRQA